MKKPYKAPMLETELFEMDSNIAGNCGTIVSLGPEDATHTPCDEFDLGNYSLRSAKITTFYDESCDCQYTASIANYMTS